MGGALSFRSTEGTSYGRLIARLDAFRRVTSYVRCKLLVVAVTQHSIRLVKKFPYRNIAEQHFSNRYYFDGGAPADTAAWTALADAIVAIERPVFTSQVTTIAAHGYAPGSEVAIFNKDYNLSGLLSSASAAPTPGDCAAVLRMATTKLTVKNHRVYVFSYFHGCRWDNTTASADIVHGVQRDNITAFGTVLLNGLTAGGRTYKRTTPDGHLVTGAAPLLYVSHRDFPR
jgi:hypothetical protein